MLKVSDAPSVSPCEGGTLDWPFFHPLEITNNSFQSADIDFTSHM